MATPLLLPLALNALLAATTAPSTAPAPPPAQAYARTPDVIYGRKYGMALTLDVFRPTANANGAGVIVVVSGGWASAHESIDGWVRPWIDRMTARGYTVFAVVHGSQPRFTIPEAIEDLNRATRFVHARASSYGVDPNRLGIMGGSAGGHLSLMQGLGPKAPDPKAADPIDRESARVAAVAAFFPPTDFFNYGEKGESGLGVGKLDWLKAPFNFVEFDKKTNQIVRVTDPKAMEEIGKAISPVTHVSAGDPPVLLISGDNDKLVPIQQSQELLEKLEAAHVPCKLIVKPGAGHGWPNPQPELDAVADWFDQYLGSHAAATTRPAK